MFEFVLFLALLLVGFISGQMIETAHFRSIRRREAETLHIPVVNLKTYSPLSSGVEGRLVSGNVVVSIDFFKKFLAGLRNIFGGRMKSYESLLDRARREAILRMKEQAIAQGAAAVINTRVETASISKGSSDRGAIGSVEVVAYGTALIPRHNTMAELHNS